VSVPQHPTPVKFQMTEEKALTRNRSIGSLGTALLNTLAATATASYLIAHGKGAAEAGIVHGFAVAFGVGACFLALGAIISAVLVSAKPGEIQSESGMPATPPAGHLSN
jgi:hypothetical protein